MRLLVHHTRLGLVEARPQVQIVFLMRFAAGVMLCAPGAHELGRAVVGAVAWFCATVAVYVFNGVADRAEDVANGSSRPIARGDLPVRSAVRLCVALSAAACAASTWLGARVLLLMALYLMLGYCYSGPPFPFKLRYYSTSIGGGALGLLTYLGGALATVDRFTPVLMMYAVMMSLWMGAVGGIAKDLSDVAGDRAAGRRSWPVVLGERRARLALRCAAVAVAVSFAVASAVSETRILLCSGAVLLGAAVVVLASVDPGRCADRGRRRLPYRAFMWTQYLSHAVLAAVWGGFLPA